MTSLFSRVFQKDHRVFAQAHGRVNLIGEHTDYNGGFVLPTPIPQATRVWLAPRPDRVVQVFSTAMGEPGSAPPANAGREPAGAQPATLESCRYLLGSERRLGRWTDYIQGITTLAAAAGWRLEGFEALVDSNVPIGSGLSSSAALGVAFVKALREAFAWPVDDLGVARFCQRIENEFVGARVGIMDPMASSLGRHGEALFVDTRDLSHERLPLPLDILSMVVINSGQSHSHAHGGYNQRRRECEEACARLEVKELRDLGLEDLPLLNRLPEPLLRRARHVITENARVLQAVGALRRRDAGELGRLFVQSHESMRDDYEVSTPEIDFLVGTALGTDGVFGARLTGGGFGGSVVVLVDPALERPAARHIATHYQRVTGLRPTILVPEEASEVGTERAPGLRAQQPGPPEAREP